MSSGKRLVIFLAVVVGFVLILVLIFGNGGNDGKKPAVKKAFSLLDYIDRDSKVIAITDGKVNGDDVHRAVRITVSRGNRTAEVIQGYQGTVIDSRSYPNNQRAYEEFLQALARVGFGKERKTSIASSEGICPASRRYIFRVIDNNDTVSNTWTANCTKGSSPADPDTVVNLFQQQITDYSKLLSKVNL